MHVVRRLCVVGCALLALHALPGCGQMPAGASAANPRVEAPGPSVPAHLQWLLAQPPVAGKLSADPRFRSQVSDTYARSGYAPRWLQGGRPSARADEAMALLEAAADEGLRPQDYKLADLQALRQRVAAGNGNSEAQARFDLTLSFAMARYVSEVRVGRVLPQAAGVNFDVGPAQARVPGLIDRMLGDDKPAEVLVAARPPVPLYNPLRKALARYRALVPQDAASRLPPLSQSLKPGMHWAGVPALSRRLALLGDYQGEPATGTLYQGEVVAAFKRFQERHGLQVDGVLGRSSHDAINTPLSWRVRQIELSMERMRWMGVPAKGKPHIVVNIPQYRLWAFPAGSGQAALSMEVMVGEPKDRQTPVMDEQVTSIVFSPYWNVPDSIIKKELLPRLRKDPQVLVKENMELVSETEVIATAPDKTQLDALAHGAYRVRQRPGPWNALGGAKFEFPNTHAIYMHDTQSRNLFGRARRGVSHGCIRLQHPQALAEFLLKDEAEWDTPKIAAAMSAGKQQRVRLHEPVPVLLFYNTTMVSLDGRVAFLDDIYGLDRQLDTVLRGDSR